MAHATLGMLAGLAMLGLAALIPDLLGGDTLANALLKPAYKLPELMPAYVPELRAALQASLTTGARSALAAFVIWVAATRLGRPTGPRQVRRSWRLAVWLLLAALPAVISYVVVDRSILGRMEAVEAVTANRIAAMVAVATVAWFWLLSLLGAEPMMRPAVPLAAFLTARR